MANYLKPGFPEKEVTDTAIRYNYEYIGPFSALKEPDIGTNLAGRPVVSSRKVPVPGTALAEMWITTETAVSVDPDTGEVVEEETEETDEDTGTTRDATYPTRTEPIVSVDWAAMELPIRKHPNLSAMTARDHADVENWQKETDPELKGAFQYKPKTGSDLSVVTLGPLAQTLARCINRGCEAYQEYRPVVRKTSIYRGSGPVTGGGIGQIWSNPPSQAPNGWTYYKSADSVTGSIYGGQWEHNEEWTGIKELLVDADTIYI